MSEDDAYGTVGAALGASGAAVELSRLVPANIREVWATEAGSFTPWLLDNADVLSEVLGLEVELEDREHKVGTFSLDLIGRVAGSEQIVIIENQFGPTDHGHLGQIMTYAGGTDPTVVVWIAEIFREEHRAALDWLNQNTHTDLRLFGVALAAVRMKGGDPALVAPNLELVCKPNDWEKIAKQATVAGGGSSVTTLTTTPLNALYKQFWEQFEAPAKARNWTTATAPAQNWWSLPTGNSGLTWGVSYANFGCRSELYIDSGDPLVNRYRLEILQKREPALSEAFGSDDLIFDYLPGKRATRVDVRRVGPKVTAQDQWEDVIGWMIDTQERLRKAVMATGGLPTDIPPPGWTGEPEH
jgi:hypothetical protein